MKRQNRLKNTLDVYGVVSQCCNSKCVIHEERMVYICLKCLKSCFVKYENQK